MDVLEVVCHLLIVLLFVLALAGWTVAIYAIPLFFAVGAIKGRG